LNINNDLMYDSMTGTNSTIIGSYLRKEIVYTRKEIVIVKNYFTPVCISLHECN